MNCRLASAARALFPRFCLCTAARVPLSRRRQRPRRRRRRPRRRVPKISPQPRRQDSLIARRAAPFVLVTSHNSHRTSHIFLHVFISNLTVHLTSYRAAPSCHASSAGAPSSLTACLCTCACARRSPSPTAAARPTLPAIWSAACTRPRSANMASSDLHDLGRYTRRGTGVGEGSR